MGSDGRAGELVRMLLLLAFVPSSKLQAVDGGARSCQVVRDGGGGGARLTRNLTLCARRWIDLARVLMVPKRLVKHE